MSQISDLFKRIKDLEEQINNLKNIKINKPNFNKYYTQVFLDFICSLNIDYKTVREIGCGYGNNRLFFKNIGKEVYGVEPSKTSVKIAIDNQINIKQGFVNDLENKYDLIILKHVFEHLYDPLKDLEKIRSHINKYLFIEVPGNFRRIASIQNAHNFYFSVQLTKHPETRGKTEIKIYPLLATVWYLVLNNKSASL